MKILIEEKVTFKFIVTVKPEVKLGNYKGLDIHKEEVNVEAADVDAEITRLQERFADLVLKEERQSRKWQYCCYRL